MDFSLMGDFILFDNEKELCVLKREEDTLEGRASIESYLLRPGGESSSPRKKSRTK
jgi:hypothetical protein